MTPRLLHPESTRCIFGPVRFWRDDLDEIVTLLGEVCKIDSIKTDKYELDNIDELAELKEHKIESLVIIADGGQTRLILRKWFPVFESARADLHMRGFATELDKIARRCRRVPLYLTTPWQMVAYSGVVITVGALLLTIVALMPGSGKELQESTLFDWLSVIFFALTMGAIQTFTIGPQPPSAVLLTRTRAEAPPWFKRNMDALVTNAIVSAIFLILGVFIGRLTSS